MKKKTQKFKRDNELVARLVAVKFGKKRSQNKKSEAARVPSTVDFTSKTAPLFNGLAGP